jgi:hypothetical protein
VDRLKHGLVRTDALEYRVRTDAIGQLVDCGDALVATLGE